MNNIGKKLQKRYIIMIAAAVVIIAAICVVIRLNESEKQTARSPEPTAAAQRAADSDSAPDGAEQDRVETPQELLEQAVETDTNKVTNYAVERALEDYIQAVNNGDAKGMIASVADELTDNEISARTDISDRSELIAWVDDILKEQGIGDTWKVSSYAITASHTYEKTELEELREQFVTFDPKEAKYLTIKAIINDNGTEKMSENQILMIQYNGKWYLTEYDLFW